MTLRFTLGWEEGVYKQQQRADISSAGLWQLHTLNNLPSSLRHSSSTVSFKSALKTDFFSSVLQMPCLCAWSCVPFVSHAQMSVCAWKWWERCWMKCCSVFTELIASLCMCVLFCWPYCFCIVRFGFPSVSCKRLTALQILFHITLDTLILAFQHHSSTAWRQNVGQRGLECVYLSRASSCHVNSMFWNSLLLLLSSQPHMF